MKKMRLRSSWKPSLARVFKPPTLFLLLVFCAVYAGNLYAQDSDLHSIDSLLGSTSLPDQSTPPSQTNSAPSAPGAAPFLTISKLHILTSPGNSLTNPQWFLVRIPSSPSYPAPFRPRSPPPPAI